jgi:hypothetical protein
MTGIELVSKQPRTYLISTTREIPASPAAVYGVFADYKVAHPSILPPSFFVGLRIEQGGYGAGTVILVDGRFAGRTRTIRGVVTEPEPGRLLVESYPAERMVTSFKVVPKYGGAEVTISTLMPKRWGPIGWMEERVVRRLLSRVFAEELDLVAAYVARPGSR